MLTTQAVAKYRASGQKITPQRLAVLRALEGDGSHPPAAAVVEKVQRDSPCISPATVYRILNELAGMGEIQILTLDSGTVRFDPNVADHAHLLCERCGRLEDIPWALPVDILPEMVYNGYQLAATQVVFRGICPDCQSGHNPSPEGCR